MARADFERINRDATLAFRGCERIKQTHVLKLAEPRSSLHTQGDQLPFGARHVRSTPASGFVETGYRPTSWGVILMNRSCGTYRTTRYFFARYLRGVGTVSQGYSGRMIPILGRMVSLRDRRAPCERVVLALRQLGDVGGSVVQGMQLAAAGQGNGRRRPQGSRERSYRRWMVPRPGM